MREKPSMDAILGNFDMNETENESRRKDCRPVTIWISASAKARYDRLQKLSGRRFSKKAREILLAAIDMAEAKAS
jgi:hypothetical protein